MIDVLGIINKELNSISVPYEYMRWTSDVQDLYFVGEYSEVPIDTEDGAEETSFILTGFTRNKWLELEQHKNNIKSHFNPVSGFRTTADCGAVAIFYENSFPVPTDEADLKRIQINLKIKQWKGMN